MKMPLDIQKEYSRKSDYRKKLRALGKRLEEGIKVNPKIMLRQSYKASELKKMGLTQKVEVSCEREIHHNDQAESRRLSA